MNIFAILLVCVLGVALIFLMLAPSLGPSQIFFLGSGADLNHYWYEIFTDSGSITPDQAEDSLTIRGSEDINAGVCGEDMICIDFNGSIIGSTDTTLDINFAALYSFLTKDFNWSGTHDFNTGTIYFVNINVSNLITAQDANFTGDVNVLKQNWGTCTQEYSDENKGISIDCPP